jgi:hypothetical protein
VKREILLQPSELDNVIIALESKKDSEKLVLSDKSQLVNALTAIE